MFQDVKIRVRILAFSRDRADAKYPSVHRTCSPQLSVFRLINTQSMTTPYLKCKSYTSCSLPPVPSSIGKIVLREDKSC